MPYRVSHERMMRDDRLYDACLVLDWNIRPRRRSRGSAIFFHLARPGFKPTEGCVAVSAQAMRRLLPRADARAIAGRSRRDRRPDPCARHPVRSSVRGRTLASGFLALLPDVADRVLICDALVYRCDLFCTKDWGTILKYRTELEGLPIEIVTPTEWWEKIRPHAALWA